MSRVEENREIVSHFVDEAMKFPKGTYEEMMAWHLGAINSFLLDISKSLAVIADHISGKENQESD